MVGSDELKIQARRASFEVALIRARRVSKCIFPNAVKCTCSRVELVLIDRLADQGV